MTRERYIEELFSLSEGDEAAFNTLAEYAFRYQRNRNPVYRAFLDAYGTKKVDSWEAIPPLPIAAFKTSTVAGFPVDEAKLVFRSSGTASGSRSRHYVRDPELYGRAIERRFSAQIGRGPYSILAHLPGYQEHGDASSLLYMVRHLVNRFGSGKSGFYLRDITRLKRIVEDCANDSVPILLFGVAFGLLNLVDTHAVKLPENALVVETGGMKMRRREIDRQSLHERLATGFDVPRKHVISEYGMCELMSQCYTNGGTVFEPAPWMRIRIVDTEQPPMAVPCDKPGLIEIVDLANIDTVSAILTEDIGRSAGNGFEILGRLKGADLRGCNYLLDFAD